MERTSQTVAPGRNGLPWRESTALEQRPSTLPLFRPEAFKRYRHEPYGEIILIRPLGLTLLVCLAIAMVLAALTFLICGHYTNKARVSGVLLPDKGLIKLYAPQASRIVACHVHEGQQVKKGDVLFELSSERSNLALGSTEAEIRLGLLDRRQSLVQQRADTLQLGLQQETQLRRRLELIHQQQAHLAGEIAATKTKLALAEQSLERFKRLRDSNLISTLQLQEKEAEPLEQQKALEELERSRVVLEGDGEDVRSELRKLPAQTSVQSAALDRNISELDGQLSELEADRTSVVRAPEDGTISAIVGDPGVTVQATSALATLMPGQAKLEAHLYAPSRAVGFIKPGEKVWLRYQAYPSEKFGRQAGVVSEVSQVALNPAQYAFRTGGTVLEPMYEITVTLSAQEIMLYGQPRVLQPEMAIDADIELDRRRLIEWIFAPLLRPKGRLGA
jgi:membrane fusion protein